MRTFTGHAHSYGCMFFCVYRTLHSYYIQTLITWGIRSPTIEKRDLNENLIAQYDIYIRTSQIWILRVQVKRLDWRVSRVNWNCFLHTGSIFCYTICLLPASEYIERVLYLFICSLYLQYFTTILWVSIYAILGLYFH